ncbi:DMT family transporter [Pseudogracilibacillus auburnensis]|uniref:Threonine/homoserine efflux transporter RhtA n=1 Tax=Pseudogracilibacillus auburnensis TaxID=1494959 RepID=A0A2V3VZ30_9BACI|nr:EamA family transporter [Pseudogracilibacillus auburnensis]MBO1003013.1 EamA family transporter [Pseudogracilibacillus auburnensis]PXW87112.1 threonine/homoserine efflux transporter RhtA [Pseudogracilibacillus auburnensis]
MARVKGITLIILGGLLWGTTGPLLEWVLATTTMSVPFLLTVRLIVGGTLLLAYLLICKKDILSIWKMPSWRNQLVVFSIFGMLGVQYGFIATIEASNAVVATLLQFSAPIFVVVYVSISYKSFPPRYQIIGITGTLIGLFLLMTNGGLGTLLVSKTALFWGVIVGIAFAFYTIYPARLMKEWSILIVVGWAMLIGGIVVGAVNQVWKSNEWDLLFQSNIPLIMLLLILFGTLAFVLFLSSMKYISAVEASILSAVEPLTAMIISVLWFGTVLLHFQLLGVILMLIFVTWLSVGGRKKKKVKKAM